MSGVTLECPTSRDTLLIIPTHCHPTCLPLAVASAQEQTVDDLDIVVIGDGVSDDTRDALAPILAADDRVRFLDLPKGVRHGEEYRDTLIRQSAATVVSYLGDDDLLFPHHIATMRDCLEGVDFANPLPIFIQRDGTLLYVPTDLGNPASIEWHFDTRTYRNSVSLTGVSHTRESYLRLPHGWRPAPAGQPTDHHMWQQYFRLDGFRGRTSELATTAKFPQTARQAMSESARAAEIRSYVVMMAEPDFFDRWNGEVARLIRYASVHYFHRFATLENRLMDQDSDVL